MTNDDSENSGADDTTSRHILRAAEGSSESLAFVVERFDPCLIAIARYHMGPTLRRIADPEDVVMETWAIALRRLREVRFDGPSATRTVLAFLSTTVRNVINNLLRKSIRRVRSQESPDVSENGTVLGVFDRLPADITNVTCRARRAESADLLTKTIESLDPDDRAILVLRGLEQMSNTEAARWLGIESGTAAVRYHRALARLKEALPDSVFADLEP